MGSLDLKEQRFNKELFLEVTERMQFCYEELLQNAQQQEIMFLGVGKNVGRIWGAQDMCWKILWSFVFVK